MKRLRFITRIHAGKEKVWSVLWQDDTYRRWSSAFDEGSYAVSDWEKGSRVKFLNAKGNGMVSIIENNIPNELMSFRHIGEIKAGIEQTREKSPYDWDGSLEIYMLSAKDKDTELDIEVDVPEEFENLMHAAFIKGIRIIKELAEDAA
jgi:hypothetical protein